MLNVNSSNDSVTDGRCRVTSMAFACALGLAVVLLPGCQFQQCPPNLLRASSPCFDYEVGTWRAWPCVESVEQNFAEPVPIIEQPIPLPIPTDAVPVIESVPLASAAPVESASLVASGPNAKTAPILDSRSLAKSAPLRSDAPISIDALLPRPRVALHSQPLAPVVNAGDMERHILDLTPIDKHPVNAAIEEQATGYELTDIHADIEVDFYRGAKIQPASASLNEPLDFYEMHGF